MDAFPVIPSLPLDRRRCAYAEGSLVRVHLNHLHLGHPDGELVEAEVAAEVELDLGYHHCARFQGTSGNGASLVPDTADGAEVG